MKGKISLRTVILGVAALAAVVTIASYLSQKKGGAPVPAPRPRPEAAMTFEFAPWPPGNGYATFELLVDGRSVGILSNAQPGALLSMRPLPPGNHDVRLSNLALFRADGALVSRSGWCDARLVATEGRGPYGVFLTWSWTGSAFQYGCSVQ